MRLRYFTPDWQEWRDTHLTGARSRLTVRHAAAPSRASTDRRRRRSGDDATAVTATRRRARRHGRERERRGDRRLVGVTRLPTLRAQAVVRDDPRVHEVRQRPGGASPSPLAQSACNTRRATSSGSAGGPLPTSRARVVVREPTVGGDVVRRRRDRRSTASASAADRVVDVHDLDRRAPRRERDRRAPEGRAREETVRAGADDRRDAQRRGGDARMLCAPLREQPLVLGVVQRGEEAGVRSQRGVLGDRQRVVRPTRRRPPRSRSARSAGPRRSSRPRAPAVCRRR